MAAISKTSRKLLQLFSFSRLISQAKVLDFFPTCIDDIINEENTRRRFEGVMID